MTKLLILIKFLKSFFLHLHTLRIFGCRINL